MTWKQRFTGNRRMPPAIDLPEDRCVRDGPLLSRTKYTWASPSLPSICAFILLFLPRRANVSWQGHPHTHTDPHDRHNSPRNPRQPVLPSVVTQFRNAWTPFSAVSHYNTVYLSSIAQSQYIIIPPAILRENPTAFVHAGRLETEKCEAVRRKQ